MSEETFLSRWSRRKAGQKPEAPEASKPDEPPPAAGATSTAIEPSLSMPANPDSGGVPVEPPPLDALTPQADFSPFMQKDIAPELRNQAMRKLFTDPHYNVMDGLDTYIDDYSKPDPLPAEVLRQLYQAKALFLFDEEEKEGAAAGSSAPATREEIAVPKAESSAPLPALSPAGKTSQPKVEE